MSDRDLSDRDLSDRDLLNEFLLLFAHEIRSPLSVLSNDLAYLAAKYSQEDLRTSKQALNSCVELFAPIDHYSSSFSTNQSDTLGEFVVQLSPYISSAPKDYSAISSTPINVKSTLPLLRTLLTDIYSDSKTLELSPAALTITIISEKSALKTTSKFSTLRFPLIPNAAPTKLALAELYLTLRGAQITTAADRLTITIPYDAPQNTPCR